MTQPEDLIVGKSVEEIEAESSNRVNPPVAGEDRRDNAGTVLTPGVNPADAGMMGAGIAGAGLLGSTGAGGAGTGIGVLAGLTGVFGTDAERDHLNPDDARGDRDRGSSEE